MPEPLVQAAAAIVGGDAVREGTPTDAIGGVTPRVVVEPSTAEATGAVLEWATRDKLAVVPRGSGTKLGWGGAPRRVDIVISMARLNGVVAHRHGDLTATIQAGATLASVNRALSAHRQWIPLDPPWADRATIGGLVATNDSGPRRHRYGAPRDLIIGVEFARADGRLAKGGGIVVKNVAGYDLPRLMTGSFGALGIITTATFKLYPLTAASKTIVADVSKPPDVGTLASRISHSHLTPTALEFTTDPMRVIVRFESIEASVDQQCETASRLIAQAGFQARAVDRDEEDRLWTEHCRLGESTSGLLMKVSVVPTDVPVVLAAIDRASGGRGYAAAGRAGLGVFLVRVEGDPETYARVLDSVRTTCPPGRGSAVVVRAPVDATRQIEAWGSVGDGLALMKAVKEQFDPNGVLSPGRGPGGI